MMAGSTSEPAMVRQWRRGLSRSDVPTQFLWYLLVGGLSFLVDLALYVGLLGLEVPVMAALAAGFLFGTLVNYLLSLALAFTGGRYRRPDEILRLFVIAFLGLGLTAALVSGFMELANFSAVGAKLAATPIALAWNYVGRRLFVFRPEMPLAIWRISAGAWDKLGVLPAGETRDTLEEEPQAARDPLIETLALRERFRDDYIARHDPIADERLLWRAHSFRHLVHLLPGQSILELGCGSLRFTARLAEVSRGENPIVAATFQQEVTPLPAGGPPAPTGRFEHLRLEALPGALEGRRFDCVVWLDLLDKRNSAALLGKVHELLAPGGQLVSFESNPWNPWLEIKRLAARFLARSDPRGLVSRPRLYELLSAVGFTRVFAIYTDFVYAPLTPRLIWLLRNLSLVVENTPFLRRFAGTIVLCAEKPPRRQARPDRPLADHESLRDAVSVVIPCHNEEMNVGRLIERLLDLYGPYVHEIVPVEDNSSDATAAVLARYAAEDARVRPVYRSPPNGVGRAIAEGYRAARGRWILSMDCDFQHLLPEIRDLFDRAAAGADVVVGSRFSRHSVLLNYPLGKIIANRGFHVAAQLAMGRRFRDVTNNLKLMRREVAEEMRLSAPGFAINAETGLQPMLLGYQVEETPISWIDRSFDMGSSSFRLLRVGGGYASVLWRVFLARVFRVGPYAGLLRQRPS